ncbi:MAG: amino acid ABC transporter permease [Oscillospiraceae bacterium]|nr:amino acid ABC transporter permease [Oscillospiraceae bacterium]
MWDSIVKIVTPDNVAFMLKSAGMSLLIATGALLVGTILGILGAMCKISRSKVLHVLANIYVELIRGTPMMLQILFFFLGVPTLWRLITGNAFSPNPYLIGWIAISINSGAYSTELIRSGIQSIDRGQWEAGKALGMPYGQILKKIILPQSFKRIVPPLVSEFIVLIKDSSLISNIGAIELLKSAQILGARYYNYLIPLCCAGIVYLVMTVTISFFAKRLERRLAASD